MTSFAAKTLCRLSLMLAFVCVLTGVAFGQSTAPKQVTKNDVGKCIGVVSAIGDTLSLSKFGYFKHESSKVSIDGWRIDDLVFSKISSVLNARQNLKRLSFPKGAFAVLEENHGPLYSSTDDVKAILSRIASGTKCDRYLVVMKSAISFQGGQRIDGLGILEQGGKYSAWAEYTINSYDGRDLALISKHPAITKEINFLGKKVKPGRQVDGTWWPASDGTPSVVARDGFQKIVAESVEATAQELLKE